MNPNHPAIIQRTLPGLLIAALLLCACVMPVQAVRYPASDTAAGMWVDYTVSGATITSTTEADGRFSEWKSDVRGTVNPGVDKIVISGTAYQSSGYYATVDVGDKSLGSIDRPAYTPKTFSVEVPVPADGSRVDTGIWMTGSYDAGSRYLTVSMKFENPNTPAPTPEPTDSYDRYPVTTVETYSPVTYSATKPPATTTVSSECDRMSVDINEQDVSGNPFTVLVTVRDLCRGEPVEDTYLEYRVFHSYDNTQCIQYNGVYADFGPELCRDGTCTSTFSGTDGDTYRVDVYASKAGWNDADASIHVTPGGDPGICRTYTYGKDGSSTGSEGTSSAGGSSLSGSGSSHYGASETLYETYDFSDGAVEEPLPAGLPVLAVGIAGAGMVLFRRRGL